MAEVSAVTSTAFATSVTSMPVNLPEVEAGDLLIAAVEVRNSGSWTVPDEDWHEFESQLGGSSVGELTLFYRIADGNEGSTDTFTASVGTTAIWQVRKVTGWHGTTPPESDTASGDVTSADPPTLTPSWGEAKTTWIVFAGHTAASAAAFTAGPSDYDGFDNDGASSGGAAVSLASAYRELETDEEDPGTFTAGGSNRWWAAATVAIRPGEGGGPAEHDLEVSDLSIGVSSGTPTLVAEHQLVVQSASIGVTSGSPNLTAEHNLAVQNVSVGVSSENATLTAEHNLVVQNSAIGVAVQSPTLTAEHELEVQNASIGVVADNLSLTANTSLEVQNVSVGVSAGSPTLTAEHQLVVQSLAVGVIAGNPTLTAEHALVVQNLSIGVSSENVNLDGEEKTPQGLLMLLGVG